MTVRVALVLVFVFAALTEAAAQTSTASQAPDDPVIRVGMLSYVQYDAELENRQGYNTFDLTRAYLNINGQLASRVRFRFTPDIRRVTDGAVAGSLVLRVKYAFLELDDVTAPRSWMRFGAHQTPWLDFEEGINRYRVQGTMFSEREGLVPGSSDFGVGYFTPLGKYLEIQAGVYNGEGYAQADANKYKSAQARLTIRPLAGRGIANGLRVSGFYSAGWYAANRPRNIGTVMASFEHPNLVATLQYLKATDNPDATLPRDFDRNGESGFVEVRQGANGWAALARLDHLDPDALLAGNSQRRVIVGGAYWFVWPRSRVGLVVTNEQVRYGAAAQRPHEDRVLVQTHVEF